jgi:hypothetical protein
VETRERPSKHVFTSEQTPTLTFVNGLSLGLKMNTRVSPGGPPPGFSLVAYFGQYRYGSIFSEWIKPKLAPNYLRLPSPL